jgi:predicted nucleic-acid-binding protein
VKLTADANVLVRVAVMDDPDQAAVAQSLLRDAETVALALPALCEFVWVLRRGYGRDAGAIAAALRRLIDVANVAVDRQAVLAGLGHLENGGDFADGIIAWEGRRAGGDVFATFDAKAAALVERNGGTARLLAAGRRS